MTVSCGPDSLLYAGHPIWYAHMRQYIGWGLDYSIHERLYQSHAHASGHRATSKFYWWGSGRRSLPVIISLWRLACGEAPRQSPENGVARAQPLALPALT